MYFLSVPTKDTLVNKNRFLVLVENSLPKETDMNSNTL